MYGVAAAWLGPKSGFHDTGRKKLLPLKGHKPQHIGKDILLMLE